MIIVGAKGFAKEILQIFHQKSRLSNLAFYDDINFDLGQILYEQFPILRSKKEALSFFQKNNKEFTVGIGNPQLRHKLANQFITWGGKFQSIISYNAQIGNYGVKIGSGVVILNGVNISNDVEIGSGTMIYYNCNITHDCEIGKFVEMSPTVNILGNSSIGSFTHLGANSTILPKIRIGKNVVIGAGAVVTTDIPDNSVAVGIPARIIKTLPPMAEHLCNE